MHCGYFGAAIGLKYRNHLEQRLARRGVQMALQTVYGELHKVRFHCRHRNLRY